MPQQRSDHTPQQEISQRTRNKRRSADERFARLRSPFFGYVASLFLVGVLMFIEKIDEHIPQISLVVGTPFVLLAILIALVWGTGPALVALVFGLLVVLKFVSPNILTTDFVRDVTVVGPFILLQLVAIAAVMRLERVRRELRQTNQQLMRANVLKDYVLIRAAHELRTPLTTILGRTQLLASRLDKSGETPENWTALQNYLEVVEARSLHLRALIDSLFDLSRVCGEEISSPLPICDLISLCREVIEDHQALSGRAIELNAPDYPIMLAADHARLSQVLAQLMSNAIKYSSDDSIVMLHVHAEKHAVTLQVHNDGPALSPEQIEHLFDPFYRTPEVEYSLIPGWGLGLTISKEIVERHGGRIWAESSRERGISFFIKLPLPRKARESHKWYEKIL